MTSCDSVRGGDRILLLTGLVATCTQDTRSSGTLNSVNVLTTASPVLGLAKSRVGDGINDALVSRGTDRDSRVLGHDDGDERKNGNGKLHFEYCYAETNECDVWYKGNDNSEICRTKQMSEECLKKRRR
jgi:hypothetical protein